MRQFNAPGVYRLWEHFAMPLYYLGPHALGQMARSSWFEAKIPYGIGALPQTDSLRRPPQPSVKVQNN